MKKFIHLNVLDDIECPERKTVDGKRMYVTPNGEAYPSITTILGRQPKPSIEEWKKRVGEKEAKAIIADSTRIGTGVHELCEKYLYNIPLHETDEEIKSVFNRMRFLCGNINNIYGLEIPVYSDILRIAGTTDCVAEYNGVLSVIDFKTSKKPKREDWIDDYYIQAFFYAAAFYEMTGAMPEQVVILVAVRNSFEVQVFKKSMEDDMDTYIKKLINIMDKYPVVIQQN
jgi:genome maintenance exonuclease 1